MALKVMGSKEDTDMGSSDAIRRNRVPLLLVGVQYLLGVTQERDSDSD